LDKFITIGKATIIGLAITMKMVSVFISLEWKNFKREGKNVLEAADNDNLVWLSWGLCRPKRRP
jgi:hypothetical protein